MAIGGNGQIETGLGGPIGLGEIEVPRNDDGSFAVDASSVFRDGLFLFGKIYRNPILYINTNGTVSISEPVDSYVTQNTTYDVPVLAAFWGDVDTRLDGEGLESGGIWADLDIQNGVFSVTWFHVGVYRRNAELTNIFQLQLVDQGDGDFDIAFRYQQIQWSIGTAEDDLGAVAGIYDPSGPNFVIGPSNLQEIDDTHGNGGELGLWAYSIENGQIRDYLSQIQPILGSDNSEGIDGSGQADHILAYLGNDTLNAGAGSDTIDAGEGDDFVFGGQGNDEIYGRAGHDNMLGGAGTDRLFGDEGQDTLTGSSRTDVLFGGNGDDFLNGGWGHDDLTGGAGADRFYHEGVHGHGSDWITDYYAPEGDVLVFGGQASPDAFLVQYAETPDAGLAGVLEAFVTYIPTGQILWAIVDGELDDLKIQLDGEVFEIG